MIWTGRIKVINEIREQIFGLFAEEQRNLLVSGDLAVNFIL